MTSTSRGCPFKCVFCCTESIYGSSIRYQTADRVLKEIDWLVGEYGIKEIIFLDDNLVLDRKRFVQILEGLIKRDYDLHWKSVNLATFALDDELLELMVESGTYQLLLPVESGNQHVLTNLLRKPLRLEKVPGIVKKAKELGLETQAGFIIGTPGETWDQIRDTFRFAEQLDVDMVVFHVATPLPRTHLTQMAIDHGALPADFSFHPDHFFGFGKGVLTTDEFTPELLQMARALEWDRINFPTLEKRKRFIKIAGISLEELEDWRKQTLRKAGIYFPGKAEEKGDN
jgi:MoaA/NifB/PqqE/SkfB family radical SAM enzyme